jgi:hypothetical protein
MERLFIAIAIFSGLTVVLLAGLLLSAFVRICRGRASGFGLAGGSLTENCLRVRFLALLALVAYWFAGKLVKA